MISEMEKSKGKNMQEKHQWESMTWEKVKGNLVSLKNAIDYEWYTEWK